MDTTDDKKVQGSPDDILKGLQNGENPVLPLIEKPHGITICIANINFGQVSSFPFHAHEDKQAILEEFILEELKKLQNQLEESEPSVAFHIKHLRKAIKHKDEWLKNHIMEELSSSQSRFLLESLMSNLLKRFLHW